MPLLSVIVPVYNEVNTIRQILEKIYTLALDKEIIVVDDGSVDGTDRALREMKYDNLKVIYHSGNRGKGAAFLTGLANAQGEYVIVQDADLEYDPNDYLKMLNMIRGGSIDIVLGSRFKEGHHGLFIHRLGNKLLTGILNILFGSHFNDYATCYKLAGRDRWRALGLKATGFDIDVEIVCNAVKRKMRIEEIPVSYHPRNYNEGKKIRWNDGLWAIFYMLKYRFIK